MHPCISLYGRREGPMRDNRQQAQPQVELWNVMERGNLFLIAHGFAAKTSILLGARLLKNDPAFICRY